MKAFGASVGEFALVDPGRRNPQVIAVRFVTANIYSQRSTKIRQYVGCGPRPLTVGKYFPYIYTPRKCTTVWRPLEFPIFGGPDCSAGLGVREPRL